MSKTYINSDHTGNASQRMWKYCQKEIFCDVVLIIGTGGIRIPAHRLVLCGANDCFEKMFASSFVESTAKEVELHGVDEGEIVQGLVEYCYTGRIEIGENNVEKILKAADFLGFGFVVNACGDFLAEQLQPNNCFALTLLAERHHCESLSKKAKDFCLKRFVEFCKTPDFLALNAQQLGQLISSDDLHVPCEEEVFKSVMTWIEYNRFDREQNKEELFKLVRMPLMKLPFLVDHVRPLCTTFESLQQNTEATLWHLLPERRTTNASSTSTKPRRLRQFFMAITLAVDKLTVEYYCSETLKWMKCVKDMEYRQAFGFAVMDDNLFLIGGEIEDFVNTVCCLNLKTMTFKEISPMNECRAYATSAVLKGCLYIVGGSNEEIDLTSVEKWDPIQNRWNFVASMSVCRLNAGVTAFNDKLYVVGGSDDYGHLRSAEYYDPEQNVWMSIASMHKTHLYPGVAVSNGLLYAMGGSGERTIECYNPDSNEWTVLCKLNEQMLGDSITIFGKKVMLLYNDRIEEYDPITNECKVNASINVRALHAECIFSYAGPLLMEKFVENQF